MVVIFDGTLPEEAVRKEVGLIEKLLQTSGELEKTEEWGKRTLAFNINKKRLGLYFLFTFNGDGTLPGKVEKLFKLNANVLRHLMVIRELKNIIPTAREIDPSIADENADGGDGLGGKEGDD
jgi:small subunit ribosomal protein S6